jgi:(S)-mandelate dehydrogenase
MTKLVTVEDYRRRARRVLPRMLFDYLEGGAGDESLLHRNRDALAATRLRPHYLRDVSVRDQRTTLFGRTLATPLVIGPTGLNGAIRPRGDISLARAAARAGIPFTLSTPAQNTIEEVAREVEGELWFQLYVVERGLAERMVARALAAGYHTLVLTVDVPVNGLRHRDRRNGFGVPFRLTPRAVLDGATHPGWSSRFMRSGMPQLANFATDDATDTAAQYAVMHRQMDAGFTWDDLAWLRRLWPHTLIVKGVLDPDDAVHAIACGADGVVVSNHGGRQLAECASTIEVLPDILAKVDRPVLVDSGFRTGADIVKALALGASAVLLGRTTLYGLAARGECGVSAVLDILKAEIDTTMALIGAARIADLGPSFVQR